jgi:hypothetical protein
MATQIGDERYVSLASFRRDGREVRTPVWVAAAGGRLYVFSAGDAGKVKRIRANPRVRLAACDARGRLRPDARWLEARARLGPEPERVAAAVAALVRKYGWQMRLLDLLSGLAGRRARRAWIEIEPT